MRPARFSSISCRGRSGWAKCVGDAEDCVQVRPISLPCPSGAISALSFAVYAIAVLVLDQGSSTSFVYIWEGVFIHERNDSSLRIAAAQQSLFWALWLHRRKIHALYFFADARFCSVHQSLQIGAMSDDDIEGADDGKADDRWR
jgi:hypothetical protein